MKARLASAVALAVFAVWAVTGAAAQPSQTSLWKVSAPGRTLYITGTTELLTRLDYPLPQPIAQAFAASKALLIDADPGADSQVIAALLKARGTLPAGESLQDKLSAKQRKAFEKALRSLEIPSEKVEHLKPWLATLEITRAALGQLGITPAQGETQHFYDQAKKRGMPVRFLETASGQIRYFAAMPETLQRQWLMLQIEGLGQLISARGKVIDAWRHGDTQTLVKLIHGSLAGHPKLYNVLVTQRNDKWERTLRAKLESKGPAVFVLLGIGNLIGNDGLIARLRADGYTVKQL
jgi:uncharacterized protein YbaP (TraB family)